MRFVDTNILLYAISSHPGETAKAARAAAILNEPDLAISVQVLQEFYLQATRASSASPLTHDEATAFMATLLRFPVQELTVPLVLAALAAKDRWQISYWDAAIIEAARSQTCDTVLSEDLQHGQDFGGVRIVNPFV